MSQIVSFPAEKNEDLKLFKREQVVQQTIPAIPISTPLTMDSQPEYNLSLWCGFLPYQDIPLHLTTFNASGRLDDDGGEPKSLRVDGAGMHWKSGKTTTLLWFQNSLLQDTCHRVIIRRKGVNMARGQSNGQVMSCRELKPIMEKHRARGEVVVWTNGCFDILHAGHVLLLEQARSFGDYLVVGLNSDASVRRLKGSDRPINPARFRSQVLAALRAVDYVVVFQGNSPLRIIRELRPDIYAKGGDYTVDTVNQAERTLVEGYGGVVKTVGVIKGLSTTGIVKRARHG